GRSPWTRGTRRPARPTSQGRIAPGRGPPQASPTYRRLAGSPASSEDPTPGRLNYLPVGLASVTVLLVVELFTNLGRAGTEEAGRADGCSWKRGGASDAALSFASVLSRR